MKVISDTMFRRAVGGIFSLYLLIRVLWYILFPMDWSLAYWRWQTLDLAELRSNMLQAIFHCHQQPPLWNVFVGINVKIFPDSWGAIPLQIEYAAMSICAFWLLFSILRRLVASRTVVLLGMLGYSILPAVLYSESWLTYTFPILFLLLLSCKFLTDYSIDGRFVSFACCVATMSVIVLSRAFFHLAVWLVPCLLIIGVAAWQKGHGKKAFTLVMICFAVASLPYFMNLYRYGMFSGSTWQGSNICHTLYYVAHAEKLKLFKEGEISALALKAGFPENMDEWRELLDNTPRTGIPILDKEEKDAIHPARSPYPNMNNRIVPIISKAHGECWRLGIWRYPKEYMISVANAVFMFFSEELSLYFDRADQWLPRSSDSTTVKVVKIIRYLCVPLVVFVFFACSICGCVLSLKNTNTKFVAAFCLFNMLYTLGVSCAFELGEELIMRVPSEPLWVIGSSMLLDRFLRVGSIA